MHMTKLSNTKRALILAVALAAIGGSVAPAVAGQFGRTTMFCDTPAGPGPVLVRPTSWLGRSCYLATVYGPVWGYFVEF
jgi:hypothetical protein